MGDFPHYFDIILFAMIAVFLALRLRSVLGRRTGNERRRQSMIRQAEPTGDKVITLPQRGNPPVPPPATEPPADAVAAGLERIREADPGFDPDQFLQGVRGAFEIIVAAFAAGDKAKLRPLLSDEVYAPFCTAIDERNAARETLETRILALKRHDIAEADLAGMMARVTVKLVSDQINVVRAHDASIVDGDPDKPIEKTDFWSFGRDTRSTDPNWLLVATDSG
jgi:predicted lipid-binding transport protein (Tim44 family)